MRYEKNEMVVADRAPMRHACRHCGIMLLSLDLRVTSGMAAVFSSAELLIEPTFAPGDGIFGAPSDGRRDEATLEGSFEIDGYTMHARLGRDAARCRARGAFSASPPTCQLLLHKVRPRMRRVAFVCSRARQWLFISCGSTHTSLQGYELRMTPNQHA